MSPRRVTGAWPHVQIGSYERGSGLGLADLTIDDGGAFRVEAELAPPE